MKEFIEPIVEIFIFTENVITTSSENARQIDITTNDGDTMVGGLFS